MDFNLQKDFALSATATFAAKNLFANGGTASYVQASDRIISDGTFTSEVEFRDFVSADPFSGGSALSLEAGIAKARARVHVSSSDAAFMIVIAVGEWDHDADV